MRGGVTGAHHLSLYQIAIQGMVGDEIKIFAYVSAHLFPRRQLAVQYGHHVSAELAESMVHGSTVERLLVLEVVIKERFVDPGRMGDGVGASASNAVVSKLLNGCLQNGGTSLLGP